MGTAKSKQTKTDTSKKQVGRPNRIKEIIEQALQDGRIDSWLEIGYTQTDICEKLGISYEQWKYYKSIISTLTPTIERYKMPVRDRLIQVAYLKATGQLYTKKTVMVEGNTTTTIEQLPPDNKMLALLLHNYSREHGKVPDRITSDSQTDVQEQTIELKKQEIEEQKEKRESSKNIIQQFFNFFKGGKNDKPSDTETI